MNKEEMENKTIKIMSRKYYSKYVVDKLLEENKQLKEIIDKAMYELQKPKTTNYNGIRFVYDKQTENALKILKGEHD